MLGRRRSIAALAVLIFTGLIIYSCGGRGVNTSNSYQGPGSDWDATINNDGTFTFVENDTPYTLTGTWVPQVGPFKVFTVQTSTTGSVSVGDQAYGLDIPGVALLLQPFGGSQMITMIKGGECPTQDGTMNWIITKYGGAPDFTTIDLFGTFQYTNATSSATLPIKYKLDGSIDAQNENLGSFSCANGQASVTGATMYLHEVGALVNTTSNQFIIGFLQSEIGNVTNLADTYYGLLFQESTGSIQTVKATVSGSSMSLTDIDTNTGASSGSLSATLSIDGVDTPQDGFVKMTIGSDSVRCMANPDIASSGKKLIFCVAKDPDGTNTQLYNLLLITE